MPEAYYTNGATIQICGKMYEFHVTGFESKWSKCLKDPGHAGDCGYEDRTPY